MIAARCSWYFAGPLLGLLVVALRAVVNKPLGALGGYIEVIDGMRRPPRLGFGDFLLFGIVLGGALYAGISGTYAITWSYSGAAIVAGTCPGQSPR